MQYTIDNYHIKSENAAKSSKQQSLFLIKLINLENGFKSVLDYGCGKLRYSDILVSKSEKQVFVDSSVQLNRVQIIHGLRTTVNDFIYSNYEYARSCNLENINRINNKFDFILCSNVLSAVPSIKERIKIVIQIKSLLKSNGKALFVCQYRNSYFDSYSSRNDCIKYLDGYIIKNKYSYSFYGLITPTILEKLLLDNGMIVINKIKNNGSIYIYASSK